MKKCKHQLRILSQAVALSVTTLCSANGGMSPATFQCKTCFQCYYLDFVKDKLVKMEIPE